MPDVNAFVRSGQYLCAENNLDLSQRMTRNSGKRDGPRAKLPWFNLSVGHAEQALSGGHRQRTPSVSRINRADAAWR